MKRRAALRALGSLVSSTGVVIAPLLKHPKLLDTLLTILKTEQASDMKYLVIKVFGILGALDPETQRQNQLRHQKKRKAMNQSLANLEKIQREDKTKAKARTDGPTDETKPSAKPPGVNLNPAAQPEPPANDLQVQAVVDNTGDDGAHHNVTEQLGTSATENGLTALLLGQGGSLGAPSALLLGGTAGLTVDDYYPACAVKALLRIVRDSSLATHHQNAVQVRHSLFLSITFYYFLLLSIPFYSFLFLFIPPSSRYFSLTFWSLLMFTGDNEFVEVFGPAVCDFSAGNHAVASSPPQGSRASLS